MKKIGLVLLVLLSLMVYSQKQTASYAELWQKVQKLENDGLTKSALEVVNSISQKAKKEKNGPQIVKSLLYSSKYALILEEDAQLTIITDFTSEIEKAELPTKNILESYLATMYWQYFQANKYEFYARSKTEKKIDSIDFRTWDLTTLFNEIHVHFDASLKNSSELQKIKIADFNAILNVREGSEKYRPTLYDLLAHNALTFYTTDENSITRPADKFEISNTELLCEGYEFTTQKIETSDPTSLQIKALQIYQDVLKFHAKNTSSKAYVAMDIERLQFIKNKATFDDKEVHYLEILKNSAEKIKGNENWGLYEFEIAQQYQTWGNSYEPNTKEEQRWKLKEALQLCDAIIKTYPDSEGAEKSKILKANLLEKSIEISNEKNIPLSTPSRVLVAYKNLDELQFIAYKTKPDELEALEKLYDKNEKLAFIKRFTVAKTWAAPLKNEGDYQKHSIEILVPELTNGLYLLVATPKGEAETYFSYGTIQVTNLALVETKTNTTDTFQVIDRTNGKPIAGAQLTLTYKINYDKKLVTKTFTTATNGQVIIPRSSENWTEITAKVSFSKETAYFGDYYIHEEYSNRNNNNTPNSCFLFTDRSIYRPSQPLYFKGIIISKSAVGHQAVVPNTLVEIYLYDVNNQDVGHQTLKTNEYGSFAGEFILPTNGLTGAFRLEARAKELQLNGTTHFSVEEYKRPKFEASFHPISETYKVNDTVTVNGKALAYAGSNITNAKVSYRVKRIVHFPRWCYWYRPYLNTMPQEITHGETSTDASGNFKILFKAIPENKSVIENLPTFTYEITADVSDINGETHSASTTVNVGYHALIATITIASKLDKDAKENKLSITTSNLNGEFTAAKGTLKIYKLKAPEAVLRPRPWKAPDYDHFGKEKFKAFFPHDAFGTEDNSNTWENGELVWETTFDTGKSKEISLPHLNKWRSGAYRIELETTDKFGQRVQDKVQTSLSSASDKNLADHELFAITTNKQVYGIADEVKLKVSSAAKDLTVTLAIEKNHEVVRTEIIHLSDDSKTISIPVNKEDLGGFAINYSYAAFNSFASETLPIAVPYPATDLKIETLTFRDKLQPGTNETWAFKIKGPKGNKVAAELLASMYDASLDAFESHSWSFNPLPEKDYYSNLYSNAHNSFRIDTFNNYWNFDTHSYSYRTPYFDSFNWFGLEFGYGRRKQIYASRGMAMIRSNDDDAPMTEELMEMEDAVVDLAYATAPNMPQEKSPETDFGSIQIRKNLQETAFFFPQLQTDEEGNVSFNFTTPEALTQWELQLLAHTKTLQSTINTFKTVTQKELMVTPNAPRFLREGDKIIISSKISNLTDQQLNGQAKLVVTDAVTNKDISTIISGSAEQEFYLAAVENTQVSWSLTIPEGLQAVQYKILAKAGDFSDGEQNILPVLTNRMLVTETLPLWVRSNQTKLFSLDKLKNNASTTLSNHKLTLEITSNPAWYAVQALPYLMEYPYECNEQLFAKYYANALATSIANSNPRIQEVFNQWANADALLSNLEKNEELKALLIQETPWLRDAQSETAQKKRIAVLFNLNKMKSEQATALNKLQQNQMSSGAWSWFVGGRENRYITQHIITGLGHLKKLTLPSPDISKSESEYLKITANAMIYLDSEFIKEYEYMKKHASNSNNDHLSTTQIQYLYLRSFFKEIKTSKKVDAVIAYYKTQAQNYWKNKTLYEKAMLALVLNRMADATTADKIIRSLEENSITSDELGMYWKENTNSWYWYQAPIETQALLIEAFSEIQKDTKTIDNLKIWLLKNKQTNQWKTTKATAEAVYALLLQGSDWLTVTDAVDVLVGGEKINPSKLENVQIEAGTGYYKTSWNKNEVSPKMSEVQLIKKGNGIAWGAMYWQYFEDLDKITSAATPLKLHKKLFLKKNTATGEEISEITTKTNLKVGDVVRVRIELKADRDMEFVHMKDMRAAGFEPINVLSSYKWQDGLGYYESTKDASTNFFFDDLRKGVYVFEYDLRVNNAGDFSNGITTIQSMYAPEFSSHSEGVRVQITD